MHGTLPFLAVGLKFSKLKTKFREMSGKIKLRVLWQSKRLHQFFVLPRECRNAQRALLVCILFHIKCFQFHPFNEFHHLTAQRKMKKIVVILHSLCMFQSFFSYIPRGKCKLDPPNGNNVIHQAMENHPTMNVAKYMFRKYFQI